MKQSLINFMAKLPSGIDAAMIISPENRRYLTDMQSSAGILLVTRNNAYFIIDFRYYDVAKTVVDFEVILQGDKVFTQIDEILNKENVTTLALESDFVTLSQYSRYTDALKGFVIPRENDISKILENLRSIKSQEELSYIKQAQAITDKAFLHILDYIKIGMTEKDIALELEYTMRKLGGGIAFESIVVSGINSSLPHGVPTDKLIKTGDFLTMDFGATFNGYCSDMTRTVAIGAISDEQRHVYDTVLKSQLMAIDAIPTAKIYSEVDKVARDYIDSQGYEGCFGHSLGHSLGLYIHEEPRFACSCNDAIEDGVVLTVEPGVYLSEKFGVRIEDMVFISNGSYENLTKSEKNLITL